MLELRPNCEHCGKYLPPESKVARICSFECTFCADCVANVLSDVCSNCGGNFAQRPIRPPEKLITSPVTVKPFIRPVDLVKHAARLAARKTR